jgi:hypothetical protein
MGLDLPTAGAVYPLEGDIFIPPELLPGDAAEGIMLPMEGSYDDASGKFLASAATEDMRYTVSGVFDASGNLVGEPIVSMAEREGEDWIPENFLSELTEPEVRPEQPTDAIQGGLPASLQGRWVSAMELNWGGYSTRSEMNLMASPWFIDMETLFIDYEGKAQLNHEPWTIISVEPKNSGFDVILSAPNYYSVSENVHKAAEAAFYDEIGVAFTAITTEADFMLALALGDPFIFNGEWFNHWDYVSQYYASGALQKYIIEQDIEPPNMFQKIHLAVSGDVLEWSSYAGPGYQGRQVYGMDNIFGTLAEAQAITAIGQGMAAEGELIYGLATEEFQKRFYRTLPGIVAPVEADPAGYVGEVTYDGNGGVEQELVEAAEGITITLTSEAGAQIYYAMNVISSFLETWTLYTGPFPLRYQGANIGQLAVLSIKEGMYPQLGMYLYDNTGEQFAVTANTENISLDEDEYPEMYFFGLPESLSPGEITLSCNYFDQIEGDIKPKDDITIVITKTNGGAVIPHTGTIDSFTFTMPEEPITITISGTFEYRGYKINVPQPGGVMVMANPRADEGDTVYLTVMDMENALESITVINDSTNGEIALSGPVAGGGSGGSVGEMQYTFTMPASSVTVKIETSGGGFPGGPGDEYIIDTSTNITDGTVMASAQMSPAGETITLTIVTDPQSRFVEDSLRVTKADDETVTVELSGPVDGDEYTFTMPEYNVTVYADFERERQVDTYSKVGSGGTILAEPPSAFAGETITLTVMGTLTGNLKVTNTDDETDEIDITGPLEDPDSGDTYYTFTMPDYNVTVTAVFEGGGVIPEDPDTYNIDTESNVIGSMEYGTISVMGAPDVPEGELVTLMVDAFDGFGIFKDGSLKVVKADGSDEEIPLEGPTKGNMGQDEYTFTMPACDVTVYAEFAEAEKFKIETNVTGSGGTIMIGDSLVDAVEGETITFTVGALGAQLKDGSLKVVKSDGSNEEVLVEGPFPGESENQKEYTFVMPESDVTIYAEFE